MNAPRTIAEGRTARTAVVPARPTTAKRAARGSHQRVLTRARSPPASAAPARPFVGGARFRARARARAIICGVSVQFFARPKRERARAPRLASAGSRGCGRRSRLDLRSGSLTTSPARKAASLRPLHTAGPLVGPICTPCHGCCWGEADRGRNHGCHPRGLRGGRGRCERSGAHPRDLTRRAELFPLYLSQTTITNNNNNSRMTTSSASRTPLTRAAHGATTTTTTATAAACGNARRAARRAAGPPLTPPTPPPPPPPPPASFAALGLAPSLASAAMACGFETPSRVQAEAVPAMVALRDVSFARPPERARPPRSRSARSTPRSTPTAPTAAGSPPSSSRRRASSPRRRTRP